MARIPFVEAAAPQFRRFFMSVFSYPIILLLIFPRNADTGNVKFQEEKIYTVSEVTVKPEPVVGLKEFLNRWSKRVVYPDDALKQQVQGMVFIEFVVTKEGAVEEPAVKSGIGYGCDEAALRAFVSLSKEGWKPGIKKDEPVKVKMVLPFFYRIVKR